MRVNVIKKIESLGYKPIVCSEDTMGVTWMLRGRIWQSLWCWVFLSYGIWLVCLA